jgi:FkbM family methyltransferase
MANGFATWRPICRCWGQRGNLHNLAAELGAEVVALEPAPDTFALLEENVALNQYTVETLHMAAGAICGTCRFTSGLDALNRMDPEGTAETAVVTIDSM